MARARYLPLAVLALVWEAAPRLGLVRADSLPPLSRIAEAWFALARTGELVEHGLHSLYRGGGGLGLAILLGTLMGIGMAWWKPMRIVMRPLMEALYPVPKSALIPVTAIWLGLGDGSKILLILCGCILPVTIGAYNGARGTERVLIWSARSMGASTLRSVRDVVLPSALPELFNGIRTALALSFVLLISSELIVAKNGLGYLIGFLGSSGSYDAMFAVVLTMAILGLVCDRLYMKLTGWVLSWRE
jgi:NitT/TauT family transport system permease protein